MTRSEWAQQVARMQARWPRQPITPESGAIWFDDLAEYPVGQVEAAIVAIYRDGREWAPNGAQIRLKVLELRDPAVDHGKAFALAMEAAGPGGGQTSGLDWLRARDPLVAEAAERFPWREFCMSDLTDGSGTLRAQFRDVYNAVARQQQSRDRYRGIESAGLKVLEQANGKPTRIGDLIRLEGRVQIPELSDEGKKAVRDAGGDPDRVRQLAQGVADGRLDPFEGAEEDVA